MVLSKVTLLFPSELNGTSSAIAFLEQPAASVGVHHVEVDFRRLQFARPYATLLAAQGLRDFVRHRKAKGLRTTVHSDGVLSGERKRAVTYLGHIGFFEYVGIGYGNAPGVAQGGESYLPITQLRRHDLLLGVKSGAIQDAVVVKCRHLASMLCDDEHEQRALTYCFREIVRNAFEHAAVDTCTLLAQKYSGDQVELVIADEGIGVPASLARAHSFSSSEAALRAALEPGISGVAGAQSAGMWDNTGFGLYVVSQLGISTGSFAITSGGLSLNLSAGGEACLQVPLIGTAVKLLVSTADAEYFTNRLQSIVNEGERLAKLDSRAIKPASLSTRLTAWS